MEGPYAAEFAAAMAQTNSDYVRSMLEDEKITVAEIKDAQGQFISCLADAGIEGFFESNGFGYDNLTIVGEQSEEDKQAENECHFQWLGTAERLFNEQIINPNNEDLDSLIAQCFVRKELVPNGFTGKDFKELMDTQGTAQTISAGLEVILTEMPEIILPGGVSLSNPEASACLSNPSR